MLEGIKNEISTLAGYMTAVSIIDILISTIIIYEIIGWLKGTQAYQVAKGVIVVLLITFLTDALGLITLNYALNSFLTAGLVTVVVIFRPELRRALDSLGRASIFSKLQRNTAESISSAVTEIVEAMRLLSNTKTGALIIIERESKLGDIVDTGIRIDALIARNLIQNIFFPNSPMHDGAVIVSKSSLRLVAAGCLLPLTGNQNLSKELGTRHRAAIGMSENSDCISLIVSEETGSISYAINGKLSRYADLRAINDMLKEAMSLKDDTNSLDEQE